MKFIFILLALNCFSCFYNTKSMDLQNYIEIANKRAQNELDYVYNKLEKTRYYRI